MPRITLNEIARQTGVSANTVSLALRNSPRISRKTREAVKKAAKKLGYRSNPVVSRVLSDIRKRADEVYYQTIAILNAHIHPDTKKISPSYRKIYEGCQSRAESSGCKIDTFWLQDPRMNANRLSRILKTRSISGVIVVGFIHNHNCFDDYRPIWKSKSCISAGFPAIRRGMSSTIVDGFDVIARAMDELQNLGYRRPGLYISKAIDMRTDFHLSAAFAKCQERFSPANRIPILRHEISKPRFLKWHRQYKPDVILTFFEETRAFLASDGKRCPEDTGIILLGSRPNCDDWTRLENNSRQIGASAVDLLLQALIHNESGLTDNPRAILHRPTWQKGTTTRPSI